MVHPVPVVMKIATEEVTVIDTSKHGDISGKGRRRREALIYLIRRH